MTCYRNGGNVFFLGSSGLSVRGSMGLGLSALAKDGAPAFEFYHSEESATKQSRFSVNEDAPV